MVQDKNTQQWKFFGIASYGFNSRCNSKDYGVFVDMTKLQIWISNFVMFNCSENVKILMANVCDGKADCANGSDERHCGELKSRLSKLALVKSYNLISNLTYFI